MLTVAVIYLGSRGAGIKFFDYLLDTVSSNDFEFISISKIKPKSHFLRNYSIAPPKNKIFMLLGFKRRRILDEIVCILNTNKVNVVVIPMAHPWDLKLQRRIGESSIRVIRIVHDGGTHPGEYFPSQRDIDFMAKSSQVITLSSHVATQLRNVQRPVIVAEHPLFKATQFAFPKTRGVHNPYDLIIGRHKKYQGTDRAIKWWTRLPKDLRVNKILVIAGKTRFRVSLKYMFNQDVVFMRKWLSEDDYEDLVANAEIILCLYKEASQSGIIASAQGYNRKVLAADVGGLSEQLAHYANGTCVQKNDMDDWNKGYRSLSSKKITSNFSQNGISLEEALLTSLNKVSQQLQNGATNEL